MVKCADEGWGGGNVAVWLHNDRRKIPPSLCILLVLLDITLTAMTADASS